MRNFQLHLLLLISNIILSQTVVFEEEYKNFPFELRIDNSGIYSIASFDIDDNAFLFSSFNSKGLFEYSNKRFTNRNTTHSYENDFVAGMESENSMLDKKSFEESYSESFTLKKSYLHGKSVLKDLGGRISGYNGEEILISVPNQNQLIIKSNMPGVTNPISFEFQSNLACADLIGIDKSGNLFVLVEKYISEIPLKVQREVHTISPHGKILSRLLLPNIKYLFTLKDLQIDSNGNLYHLLSFSNKVEIVKWEGLTAETEGTIKYSKKYDDEIHYNFYTPTTEIKTTLSKTNADIQGGVSRTQALKIAETYVLHKYECSASNLAPSNVTDPGGDVVRTPDWLVVGINARIPYKWGGFNTLSQYDAAMVNGRYAGDIHTDGVSSYAVGVDCSGYVSRCWQMSYHASTAYMPNITTQYGSWDDLKPGDAVHKVGHVRLFVEHNSNGSLKIVEATSRGWGVSYYSYLSSDLTAYTPRYYNNIEDIYNDQRPTLVSAEIKNDNMASLNWSCDTNDILGYRVYKSVDGTNWNVVLDENSCTSTDAEINVVDSASYFRVASVKYESGSLAESNWSNILGVSLFESSKKILIVDGFERENGSWRGAGHTFVLNYGKALERLALNFTSIKNTEIQNSNFTLDDYDFVFWIIGDESTVDETFNSTEQLLVQNYLERGGSFFVSGSEIGWDLSNKGSVGDKAFYNNYLKANYLSDGDDFPTFALGEQNSCLDGLSFNFGQTYEEDYPDEIEPINGSTLCMKYSNGKGAGIEYNGEFGETNLTEIHGNLIYLAFSLETVANDSSFNSVISNVVSFFNNNPTSIFKSNDKVITYSLEQNHPNPFNPSTVINFAIPNQANVKLSVYNTIGEEVAELLNDNISAGFHQVTFDASNLSSGLYFYRITSGDFVDVKKMLLIK